MPGSSGGGTSEIYITSVPWKTDPNAVLEGAMGPPMWILRKRQIEDEQERIERELKMAWLLCAHRFENRATFARVWREELMAFDLSRLTDLIEKHNAYYPIEANLPSDPRSREIIDVTGEPFRPLPLPTHDALLERFPADRVMALTSGG